MKSIPHSSKLVEAIAAHKEKIESARKEKIGKCATLIVELIELAIQRPETFSAQIPVDISSICVSYGDCQDVFSDLRSMFDAQGWNLTISQKIIYVQIKK